MKFMTPKPLDALRLRSGIRINKVFTIALFYYRQLSYYRLQGHGLTYSLLGNDYHWLVQKQLEKNLRYETPKKTVLQDI